VWPGNTRVYKLIVRSQGLASALSHKVQPFPLLRGIQLARPQIALYQAGVTLLEQEELILMLSTTSYPFLASYLFNFHALNMLSQNHLKSKGTTIAVIGFSV
jgi:hypothetical protein